MVEAAVGGAVNQGTDSIPGPCSAQLTQQSGADPRVVEIGVADGVAGQQDTDCIAEPSLAQFFQKRGDGLLVVEVDVAGGPVNQRTCRISGIDIT